MADLITPIPPDKIAECHPWREWFQKLTNAINTANSITMPTSYITQSGALKTLSGTSVEWTGLPSGVKRITLNFSALSTNGTTLKLVQLGTGSGYETTSYNGNATSPGLSTTQWSTTTGVILGSGWVGIADTIYGTIVFTLQDSNTNLWSISGLLALSNAAYASMTIGSKALAGPLTKIRLTTANGTDTFDAGTANLLYEM
jgi:hypothetical protein